MSQNFEGSFFAILLNSCGLNDFGLLVLVFQTYQEGEGIAFPDYLLGVLLWTMMVKNAASAKQSFFVLFPHLYPQSFPVAQ